MAHRCKQSRLRRRHRHDSCPAIYAVPACTKRHRTHAPFTFLNRCHLTGTLLETVAPQKHLAIDSRSHNRHCTRQFHLKRHFRCPPKEDNRRDCLSICHIRIFSIPTETATEPRCCGRTGDTLQNMAWLTIRHPCRHIFNARTHGGTGHRHVSSTTKVRQPNIRCNNNITLLFYQSG